MYTPFRAMKQLVDHVFATTSSREEPRLYAAALVVQAWLDDNPAPEDTPSDSGVH
jgi:hypothetical protein